MPLLLVVLLRDRGGMNMQKIIPDNHQLFDCYQTKQSPFISILNHIMQLEQDCRIMLING